MFLLGLFENPYTDPEAAQRLQDSLVDAEVAIVWLRPSVHQRPEHDFADIALGPMTGIDVARVKQIEATKPTILAVNFINPWVINEVEPDAAAMLGTFDVKAEALLDVIRGRFNPVGKLPMSIPARQAAVDRNSPDVPGFAESFHYAYVDAANDKYLAGFGLSYPK